MIQDTSGFYKYESNNMLFGPNFVKNNEYQLTKETKDQFEYPVDGWHWFESEDEAYLFFNIENLNINAEVEI
jgi:hypothetical protein